MALGYIDDSVFSNIANSIRTKTGSVSNYYPSEMADAISNISGGNYNSGILNVTANGEYQASTNGYDGFNVVNVQVPIPTYNSGSLLANENGNYNAVTSGYDGFSDVEVNVPIPTYNSGTLSVTANGIYNASDNALDGFNSVTVAVPMPTYNSGTLTATQNGTYNASDNGYDGFSQVNVEVPAPVLGTLSVSTNGDYNAASAGYNGFNDVHVAVPIPTYNSAILNVNENGVYNAITAGYDGYSEVNVQVPTGGGGDLTYEDIIYETDAGGNYLGQDNMGLGIQNYNFNSPVHIGNNVKSCAYLFAEAPSFNRPVTIPNGVINCCRMFGSFMYSSNFNQPIDIPDSVEDCSMMFYSCSNMAQTNFYIPNNAKNCQYMFYPSYYRQNSLNIFINNTDMPRNSVRGMFEWYQWGAPRVNIFCNNLSIVNGTNMNYQSSNFDAIVQDSSTGTITWTPMENGYYNSTMNIYLYNNYSSEPE